jgi:acyl-coenzyme A synthetase/AMP-(fatty) acid ligase
MELAHQKITYHPPKTSAIILNDVPISYGDLTVFASYFAGWLSQQGIVRGDIVAVSVSDAVLQICLTLGLMQVGAAQASLDPRLPPANFQELLKRLRANHLVTDAWQQSVDWVAQHLVPSLGSIKITEATYKNSHPPSLEDIALLCHGSGTTGDPKIMAFSHKVLLARCQNVSSEFDTSSGECSLILQRHTSMTYLTRALQCFYQGGCLVEVSAMRQGSPDYWDHFCKAVDLHDVRHVHCTVVHAQALTELMKANTGKVRFPRIKSFIVGASPVSPLLRDRIVTRLTPNLCINYGTNEAGTITRASSVVLKRHPNSVGMTAPLTEFAIVSANGEIAEPGKQGMVVVRGPCVINRYEEDEKATIKVFKQGWFYTGDIGYITEDNALYLLGRSDDMMIISGVNVYPAEVEKHIEDMPAVKEVAVTALYSELGHGIIVAFVVLGASCTAKEIIETCRKNVGWKAPNRVFFVSSIPRNFAGKVLRRELVKQLMNKA